ncbi:MAG TPA: ATP-binding protein [Chloroflexota bacterium]|nr:ATP-binding protein [Chloroflexota bacterium]
MAQTVLLVEDNPGDARLIREMLAEVPDVSFRLEWVDRLAGGIERVAAARISAILLDLSLPDSQGIETFRALRAHAPHLPIVVLTGLDDEEVGLGAIREGAQDYLVKGRVDGHLLIRALRYGIARKRQEEAQRFLAEASTALASSLDAEATYARVARLTIPTLADYGVVALLRGEQLHAVAAAHADPDLGRRFLETLQSHPFEVSAAHPIGRVIRDGRPLFLEGIPAELLTELASDPAHLLFVRGLRITSGVVVPLVARGRTMGAIGLARTAGGQDLPETEPWLSEEFARRAALAIDNAQLFAQAQEASRVRDSVLSSVSHDLRNPLMVVKVIAETLALQLRQRGLPDDAEMIEGLGRIDATTVKMTGLIDELLDVARLQAGETIRLNRRRTDLVALLQSTVADYQARAPRYPIRTEFTVPALVGYWDAARLERVVGNLLANAIKYSPSASPIIVRLFVQPDEGDGWAVVEVEDHGVGIPSDDLPRLFNWFQRGKNVADTTAGSGVGLAGARRIVEQHGGSIAVRSVEGVGSTFRLCLPLPEPDPPVN